MLMPKRQKHRKVMKGRTKGHATRGATVAFGEYGLKSMDPGRVSARQIEAARVAFSRAMKRSGKLWIRIFPHKPITKKAAEVPMGGGKGAPDHFVAIVKPGTILFEIDGVTEETAKEACRLAGHKLAVRTRMVRRHQVG